MICVFRDRVPLQSAQVSGKVRDAGDDAIERVFDHLSGLAGEHLTRPPQVAPVFLRKSQLIFRSFNSRIETGLHLAFMPGIASGSQGAEP
jgi:hypothetical protein